MATKPKPSGPTSRREQGATTPSTSKSPSPGGYVTSDEGWTQTKKTGTNTKAPGQHG